MVVGVEFEPALTFWMKEDIRSVELVENPSLRSLSFRSLFSKADDPLAVDPVYLSLHLPAD